MYLFDTIQNVQNVIVAVSIVIGVFECFFGYRIFRFILGCIGLIAGFFLGIVVGIQVFEHDTVILLIGIVGGIVGAFLLFRLYRVGVFIIGAFLGTILGGVLYLVAGSGPHPAVLFILAVTAGIVAVFFQRLMIIMSTAFGGAWSVVNGISHYASRGFDFSDPEAAFKSFVVQSIVEVLCWLALGTVGAIVQYKFSKPKPEFPVPEATIGL